MSSSAKGKRSEKNQEGKGAVLSRNETPKIGHPSLIKLKGTEKKLNQRLSNRTQLRSAAFLGKYNKATQTRGEYAKTN